MPKPKAGAKVTVEIFHEGDSHTKVFEGFEFEMNQESGYNRDSETTKVSSNGQQRVEIKLWKGCPTFEAFRSCAERAK